MAFAKQNKNGSIASDSYSTVHWHCRSDFQLCQGISNICYEGRAPVPAKNWNCESEEVKLNAYEWWSIVSH